MNKTFCFKKNCILFTAITVLFVMFLPAFLYGEEPVTIEENILIYELTGNSISYLEDPDKNLTIDQVTSDDYKEGFTNYESGVPNFGYTKSAYWFRFNVKAGYELKEKWLLEVNYALLDYITVLSNHHGTGALERNVTADFQGRNPANRQAKKA